MEELKELQPYLTAFNAFVGLGVLGFVLRIISQMRQVQRERLEAVRDQKEVVKERLALQKEAMELQERGHKNEVKRLEQEMASALDEGGVSKQILMNPADVSEIKSDLRDTISSVLADMKTLEDKRKVEDPSWHLAAAKASSVSDDWCEAARHYAEYLKYGNPDHWEIHFVQGVAYMNCRGDEATLVRALQAYGNAVALAPPDLEENKRARLHTYRGATFKRLERLREAESELLLARTWASEFYERNDVRYNLACVYAMMKKKSEMLKELNALENKRSMAPSIVGREEYFGNFLDDPDFLAVFADV